MQGWPLSGVLTKRQLLPAAIQAYATCEMLTGVLVCAMLVFGPWAFGTTESWSIWTLNVGGYLLGSLLAMKLVIRSGKELGFLIAGHKSLSPLRAGKDSSDNPPWPRWALAAMTVAILAYCATAGINGSATFNASSGGFEYHRFVRWLPHSLESHSTWAMFWRLLALACSFWAVTDWLSSGPVERPPALRSVDSPGPGVTHQMAPRLRLFLWTLIISGGLLGVLGIVQRESNSSKLLFLVRPDIHQSADTQFAAYAYRANAAQYFNLVWPVALGFWWLHRSRSTGMGPRWYLLLLCTVVMAACPIVSTARGGALAALTMLAAVTFVLLAYSVQPPLDVRRCRGGSVAWLALFLAGALGLGAGLGWKNLRSRLDSSESALRAREELNERARVMAQDYPIFGTGPGTFERVFELYRGAPDAYWPAQLHNDWLETRVTFGWIGCALLAATAIVLALRLALSGAMSTLSPLAFCLCLALAGCLVQARWDFPFQVYSVQWLFIAWCAVLFGLPELARGNERPDAPPRQAQGSAFSSLGKGVRLEYRSGLEAEKSGRGLPQSKTQARQGCGPGDLGADHRLYFLSNTSIYAHLWRCTTTNADRDHIQWFLATTFNPALITPGQRT